MSVFRNVVSVASFYAAAFIGAGFASGQEIMRFFVRYGKGGLVGIAVSFGFLVMGTVLIINRSKSQDARSYADFIYKQSPRLAPYLDIVYSMFALIGLAVMLAGCGDLVAELFAIGGGSIATALAVGMLIYQGSDRLLDTGALLTPPIAVLLILPAARTLTDTGIVLPQDGVPLGIGAALLYSSYNLCLSMAVLSAFHHKLKTNGQIWSAALLGNGIVIILLLTIALSIWSEPITDTQSNMPMLVLAERLGPLFKIGSSVMLLAAMFSTALAHAFALVNRITHQTTLGKPLSIGLVLFLGLSLSELGFGSLIEFGYPIIGVVGLLMFAVLLRR